ncbi:MAG: HAD family phosphatase [Pseudomonadota bacterium]|nr:HAD family phosphatase [Pseudomonadota bacterium]
MLKGVLFDFDGTLVDSENIHFHLWNDVLRPYGVCLGRQEYKDSYAGRTTPHNAADVIRQHRLEVSADELVRRKQDAFHAWLNDTELPLMAYAREAMAFFRRCGLRLAVVTGSARYGVLLSLERSGLLAMVDTVVTRDDVTDSKPHPESYLRALGTLKLAARDCVAFEDTENGVRSAKAAGVVCCAVRNEFSLSHDFALADQVFDGLEEATRWVALAYGLETAR